MKAETLFPVEIREITPEAEGVISLGLAPAGGGDLPQWAPGAHIDLHLPSGRIRKYSLCGDPGDRQLYRIAVLRQGEGGGSAEIHAALRVGMHLPVSGPFNHFPMVAAPGYLFLAGGIGVTPFLPMIAAARRQGLPWRLVYVGRKREGMAYAEHLQAHGTAVRLMPTVETGRPDLSGELSRMAAGEIAYCCGPEAMMAAAAQAAETLGIGPRLKMERFGAPASAPPPVQEGDHAFEVVLAASGQCLTVPADRPLGEVLMDAYAPCSVVCGEGYCGSCIVQVLEGEIDHRDTYLTAEEQAAGQMMVCVSRARGKRIVLDL